MKVLINYLNKDVGTRFYHAHHGLQDMNVYGALVVYQNCGSRYRTPDGYECEKSQLGYDEERVLVLSDYWRAFPDSFLPGKTFHFI